MCWSNGGQQLGSDSSCTGAHAYIKTCLLFLTASHRGAVLLVSGFVMFAMFHQVAGVTQARSESRSEL